ncbi:MAG TPA: class I SAM-dependent RNA methyltransferase [Burkholderiales bacterium]|nr:class I SAM-dependent RNA methyltransferase [Burkholderiales bacterium]
MEAFFAPCPRGLERVLADELTALDAQDVHTVDGGASFSGAMRLAYAVNLQSRVASRVLWRVGVAPYRSEHDVYAAARELPWNRWFDVRRTIRVNVTAIRAPVKSRDFVTLRIKDAVCDVFRAAIGRRPDVDTVAPDVRVHAFLTKDEVAFYLDTSGDALFKRGWRTAGGEAPLRENLAAGILRLTGWLPGTPLLDPMCGSGTFLIEAAAMALDIAPGLARAFGFERLHNFEADAWRAMRDRAALRRHPDRRLDIHGADKYGAVLETARENLRAAGMADAVELKQVDVLESSPPAARGIMVMNPPYGERLGSMESLASFYPLLGAVLKKRYANWIAFILTADLRLPGLMRLKPARRTPLYNGALECRLFEFRLVSGSMR